MSYRKRRTTIDSTGQVTGNDILFDGTAFISDDLVEQDRAEQRRRIRQDALGRGRVQSVEETNFSLVIVYTNGSTVVYNWVPVT